MMYVGAKLLARGRPERLLPGSPDWAGTTGLGRLRPFVGSPMNDRGEWKADLRRAIESPGNLLWLTYPEAFGLALSSATTSSDVRTSPNLTATAASVALCSSSVWVALASETMMHL